MFGSFGPRYLHSDAITFTPTSVLKKVEPHLAVLEAEVARAAHNLGQDCALFTTPRVIRYDSSAGIIEFERIEGLVTIGQLLEKEGDGSGILRRIGEILAVIHQHLYLPPYLRRPAGKRWKDRVGEAVALHGDFNTMNVAYNPASDSVVLLDWASARVLGERITVGPRYLDIAQFLRSLAVH
ncbi:MAG: BUD32 family EKC/KEOPS complex subunit, partial [Planctomycetota bacterium]